MASFRVPTHVHVWHPVDFESERAYQVLVDTLASQFRFVAGAHLQRTPSDSVSYPSAAAFELRLLEDEGLGVVSANLLRLTYRLQTETAGGSANTESRNDEVHASFVALQLFYEPRTEEPRIPILFITDRHPVWEALMTAGFVVPHNCCTLHQTPFREALRLSQTMPDHASSRAWMVVDGCGPAPVRVSHTGTDRTRRDRCETDWVGSLSSPVD